MDSAGMVAPCRRPRLVERPVARTRRGAHPPIARALTLIGDILAQHDDPDLFADSLTSLCRQMLYADCVP
jgi:hypothetical protein